MSTISAGTTNSTALVETGDTTGNLIIQANTSTTVGTFSSTGLAVVGSLTSTTPAAGAFTTLSASSTATLSGLTASTALALDASKNIVSVTNTGSGNNVLATSPTITGATLTTSAFNGTVGATTPSTGAFTTLSASSTVSAAGSTTIDSSGNLGIGSAPNSWDSTWNAIDFLYGGSIGAGNGGTRSIHIFDNSYASSAGGYKFSGTGYASSYYQYAGQHNWRSTAATGVSGGAVSYTTILSLAGVGKTFALEGGSSNTGIGISFPATQSASTDANTLDDYEEGTWTPTVTAVTTTGSPAYAGTYVKIGKQVTATMYSTGDNSPTATYTVAAGSSRFTLPFSNANLNNNFQPWTGTSGNGSTTAGGFVAVGNPIGTAYFITAIAVTNNICATITYSI